MRDSRDPAQSIFLNALEIESPVERDAYIQSECSGDDELRNEVQDLLEHAQRLGQFMDNIEAPSAEFQRTFIFPQQYEAAGTEIGPYRIREQLGEGGMGVVYVAEQTNPIRRKVALKIIKPGMDTKEVVARFEAERQALAIMSHPNISKVLDGGTTENGRPYFVMELVKGIPITQFCDQQKLNLRQRLELFVTVCQAVQHAHLKGIIHRDLKPSNVLVEMHDIVPAPKVIDFGIAKATNQQLTQQSVYTQFAQLVGTPLYMSPEQAQLSSIDVDTRSDVYSLGVLLYELLTGVTPFDQSTLDRVGLDEMRRIIREEDPLRPSQKISTLDNKNLSTISESRRTDSRFLSLSMRRELDWIVMRAMEKDRTRRYESASDFAQDIQRYLDDNPVEACPPSRLYRLRKFTYRHRSRLLVSGLLSITLLTAIGSFGWAIQDRDARNEENALQVSLRQQRVKDQVELILDEAEGLVREQKWPEAMAAAKRAHAVIASGDADRRLEADVEGLLSDIDFSLALEKVKHSQKYWVDDGEYASVFNRYGIDMINTDTTLLTSMLITRTRIRIPIVGALDDWALQFDRDSEMHRRLLSIASSIDDNPLRNQLRELWNTNLSPENQRMTIDLIDSLKLKILTPVDVQYAAETLKRVGLGTRALSLLREAVQHYPSDFDIHQQLGDILSEDSPPSVEEAKIHYRIAHALRPESPVPLTSLGIEWKKLGDLDRAITYFQQAVQAEPTYYLLHHNLGEAYELSQRAEEAVACYETAIQHRKTFAPAHFGLGKALIALNRLEEGIHECHIAVTLDPDFTPTYNILGIAAQRQGDYELAAKHYNKAIELNPNDPIPRTNLGSLFLDQGDYSTAREVLSHTIARWPLAVNAHIELGNVFLILEEYEKARECFIQATNGDSKNWKARTNLGYTYYRLGKIDDAIQNYKHAILMAPTQPIIYFNLGLAFRDQRDFISAVDSLKEAERLDPRFVKAHFELAQIFENQKLPDEAIDYYQKVIDNDSKNAEAYDRLAYLLETLGRIDEAIACYRKGIDHNPNEDVLWTNLGNSLASKEELNDAVDCYRKAIDLNSSNSVAHDCLGVTLQKQGKYYEAIQSHKTAINLKPNYAESHNHLGIALEKMGKMNEALSQYRKCIEIDPSLIGAYINSGSVLMLRRNYQEAVQQYQKALNVAPDCFPAHIKLAQAHRAAGHVVQSIQSYRRAIELQPLNTQIMNQFAWLLATCPQNELRDPETAVEMSFKATQLVPNEPSLWNTHGVSLYRAGRFNESVTALNQSRDLDQDQSGLAADGFFLAMAHWQLDAHDTARDWLYQAETWMETNAPDDEELIMFRDEAREVIGLPPVAKILVGYPLKAPKPE